LERGGSRGGTCVMHLKDGELVVEYLRKDVGGGGGAMSMRAKNIVAGSCGGLTMISIFHPLDTIKTRYKTPLPVPMRRVATRHARDSRRQRTRETDRLWLVLAARPLSLKLVFSPTSAWSG